MKGLHLELLGLYCSPGWCISVCETGATGVIGSALGHVGCLLVREEVAPRAVGFALGPWWVFFGDGVAPRAFWVCIGPHVGEYWCVKGLHLEPSGLYWLTGV